MPATAIFNYTLSKTKVANPDGSHPATVKGCSHVSDSGSTPYGSFTGALAFGTAGSIAAPFAPTLADAQRFCARTVFRATKAVTAPQDLLASSTLAFVIQLAPGTGSSAFQVRAMVENAQNGWSGASTLERLPLKLNQWYAVDLVYDIDTLGLFIDQNLIAVSAFPTGALAPVTSGELVIGVAPDHTNDHFPGHMELAEVFSDIPANLEAQLDLARGDGEWFIRLKENTLAGTVDLGARAGDIAYSYLASMDVQRFDRGVIGYPTGYPAAFVMYGAIYQRYLAGALEGSLGALVSDESDARAPGSRRSVFERGAIYWSRQTPALEVLGRMYLDYELLAGSASMIGLPTAPPERIGGGTQQVFQYGRMYYRDGASNAFEVHGDILAKYLATGGPAQWGFPTSNESDVLDSITHAPVGRQSEFERCTILWSGATGAHIIYGSIRDTYNVKGGAALSMAQGGLGFPTSDESDTPGASGFARYNTFQRGAIVFQSGTVAVCTPFHFHLGNVSTTETEGWGQGQNDLYAFIEVWQNGMRLFSQRYPDSGSYDDSNSHDFQANVPVEIVPNDPNLQVEFKVDVWDEDGGFGGDDDHIGTFSKTLTIANGWGLLENAFGIFNASGIGGIQSLDWSIQPSIPPGTPNDFWGAQNQGTSTLTYQQYGDAFSDIDDDPEWDDPSDWAQESFFSSSIQSAAAGGNCLGMCIEALYAWRSQSLFSVPLARFTGFPIIQSPVNVKQIYWYGSDCLSFTDDQIKDQNLSPAQIFQRSRQSAQSGNPSIIYFFSNSDFTGSGHAVLATAWDDSTNPWTITAFDPNRMNVQATVNIDPAGQWFSFNSAGLSYGGGPGQGAIGYIPFSTVNHRQSSPVWDPTLLLFGLVLVALGADTGTESITDSTGANLWMSANRSGDRRTYASQFRSVAGLDGSLDGELLVRRVRRLPRFWDVSRVMSTPLTKLIREMPRQGSRSREQEGPTLLPIAPRLARMLVQAEVSEDVLAQSPQQLTARARPGVASALAGIIDAIRRQSTAYGADYTHKVRANDRGRARFDYLLKYKLAETRFRSLMDRGEVHTVDVTGLGGQQPVTKILTQRDKRVEVEHLLRLGRSADFMRVRIGSLPVRAGLDLSVSIRPGLAAIDILTAGDRVDAPVQVETVRGSTRTLRNFMIPMEAGLRLAPSTVLDSGLLKAARISTMFGDAGTPTLVSPS